jgi:hypothetical protein
MGTRTSDGILAIWRGGEVRAASVLPLATQKALMLLGVAGVHALASGIFEARNFEHHPEWRHPTENYLANSRLAWRLGEVSTRCPGLCVLVYRNAGDGEIYDMQAGLQVGFNELVAVGRSFAGIANPREEEIRDRARALSMGQLYTPVAGFDTITDYALAELTADPAPDVGATIHTLPGQAQTLPPAAAA